VAGKEAPTPGPPIARFDTKPEALDLNSGLIVEYGNDFEAFLANQCGTTLFYGSEFCPLEQIEEVLGTHPNFPFFKRILLEGMPYSFTRELLEEERKAELSLQLKRGNHKSTKENTDIAVRLLSKDVKHSFSLPVRADIVPSLKGAMVEPCGITSQYKLQLDGSRELANRLTQDLSYSMMIPDASVNSCIQMEDYTKMIYGWCMSRVSTTSWLFGSSTPTKRYSFQSMTTWSINGCIMWHQQLSSQL
jgi:hypothetical protein